MKEGTYIINLDEYESLGTNQTAFDVNDNNVPYLDSFGVEHIPKDIKKLNKDIVTNIYRIQAFDSIISEYFCIGFIDFMLKSKRLLECTNLFSPNQYEKNDKIILKYFQQNLNKLKCIGIFVINIKFRKN